ncbi:MAG: hypothetical protein ACK5Q5_19650 [Planctomycetaceae bacterium]
MSTCRHVGTAANIAETQALAQVVLVGSLIGLSWLLMQDTHELGHVLAAWTTGGAVKQVHLQPLTISSTEVRPNPSPLIVTWAGPMFGIAAPVLLWGLSAMVGWTGAYLLRFWAGFCLVANGAYLGAALLQPVGDALVLLQHGTPLWVLVVWGWLTVPGGVALWHSQARYFNRRDAPVNPRHAWGLLVIFIVCVAMLMQYG